MDEKQILRYIVSQQKGFKYFGIYKKMFMQNFSIMVKRKEGLSHKIMHKIFLKEKIYL